MTDTYANVDGSTDVAAALAWQDRIDAWPDVQAYKRHTYECAETISPILDVGCGTGHDLVELGARALGVDRSAEMVRRARERVQRHAGRRDATSVR